MGTLGPGLAGIPAGQAVAQPIAAQTGALEAQAADANMAIPSDSARVSPHTCRHYSAVQWALNHPGDLAGLQRVLGHTSIRTTQIYFSRADDLGAVERQQHMRSNWR